MLEKPSVSVIIPTKNRACDLEATIESLLAQTYPPSELVLIDQGTKKCFTKSIPIPIRYIHDTDLSGASTARNAGMAVATGDVWLFLDDDVILEPTFIERLTAAYAPGVTGVSGIVTNYKRPALGRLLWESIFVRGPFLDDRQRVYWNANRMKDGVPLRVKQFGAGLMSFRASAIKNLRFDPNLTGASPGEDIDFCASLPKGSVLLIAPRARLFHKRSPEGRAAIHWLFMHAQVNSYMRERHWRHGIWNNLCFLWLNVGYGFAAALSGLKRMSLKPWRAWRDGLRKGVGLAKGSIRETRAPVLR
jgi:glycosyltransferase involved in cell wall biosynthesis